MATEGEQPWEAAESIRQLLFQAQVDTLSGNSPSAIASIQLALQHFDETIKPVIRLVEPKLASELTEYFQAAQQAAQSQRVVTLASLRGRIWSELLHASTAVVLDALENGDTTIASRWLMLREFRTATRFTRPSADATLALKAAAVGTLSMQEAALQVKNDLLDTYFARMNDALAEIDLAIARGFRAKSAEYAGLALGYFKILQATYGEQRGADAAAMAHSHFSALISGIIAEDADAARAARTEIDRLLKSFRPVPLPPAEQARRAGQLLRFLPLVSVEYARGVRDGRVTNDIEIQEALTFREGAASAFADLQLTLAALDPEQTERIAELFRQAEAHIRNTAAPSEVASTIRQISEILIPLMPAEWQTLNTGSDFDVIDSILDQIAIAVRAGQYDRAESARVEAYAILDSGIEQRLNGFAPEMSIQIEYLFWHGSPEQSGLATLIGERASAIEINRALGALRQALQKAQAVLSVKSAPTAVVGNAAIIVFREGLEAVLILASLLASLRGADTLKYRRPIVAGALLALGASVVTWWIANSLLMSLIQYGERLEAVVSLIAIGVLLLILNWFFHKVYWTGWIAGFHNRKGQLIAGGLALGQFVGLMVLGFSSIYREGFETVLFLQSLVLDAGLGTVLQGVAVGMIGVAIVGFITFALQVRLPYKKMLIVTGIMIGAVLLIMVGNTVHVLQAVGWLPITPIAGLYIPHWMGQWFGIHATWQGIGLQFAAAAYVIGTYIWAERANHRKKRRASLARTQLST